MKRCIALIVVTCFVLISGISAADTAREILDAAGVDGGLIVHLGCGDGGLTTALRENDGYLVHGLDKDGADVEASRKNIESAGLYGPVSAALFDGEHLPYIDSLVNLIVAEEPGSVSEDEMLRVLAPEGVALVGDRKIVKSRPNDTDVWTHFLHGADGNAVADDTVVDMPYHMQWAGGPRYARTHEGVPTVNIAVSDGRRVYYIADDAAVALPEQIPSTWALIARDAFNGVVLWKRSLRQWQARSAGSRHNFPPDLHRRLVAGEQHVYATLTIFGPVSVLDPATGSTVREYEETRGAEEILYDEAVLYVVVNPASAKDIDRSTAAKILTSTQRRKVVAIDTKTGKTLWSKNDGDTVGLVMMSTTVADGHVVFQNRRELICLNTKTGKTVWRTERAGPESRPVYGTPTVVIAEGVVLSADRSASDGSNKSKPKSELVAYDLKTGKKLWSTPSTEGSHIPNELFVVDGLVWAGEQNNRSQHDYRLGRDIRTGEVKRTHPVSDGWVSHHHHRCYRDKATSRFILAGRTGVEFIDVEDGELAPHHWIRGMCKFGVLPCNGLLYVPPNQCSCYQESLLNGFNALAPRRTSTAEPDDSPRLAKGPAYGHVSRKTTVHEWSTYRGNVGRTGFTSEHLPASLKKTWQTEISGKVTPPVIADGRVYVAATDRHTIYALDHDSGETLWRYTAGGRVDSPPTIANGYAVFGCRDGWVYALRASDGVLAWRYRAAPTDRRLVAHGQCESVWPVNGSVLVEDGRVYFAAGRYSHLDGGVACSVVDLQTGKTIAEKRHYSRDPETGGQHSLYTPFDGALLPDRELPGVMPDVPLSDGTYVYMRSVAFDREFNPADKYVQHLFAANGFTDDAWYQRLFWVYGNHQFSGLAGRHFNKGYASVGRLLVHDEDALYGYRDYTMDGEGVFAVEKTSDLGVFDSEYPPSKKALKKVRKKAETEHAKLNLWTLDVPFYVRAMVATSNSLVLAGPPKHEPDAAHEMIKTMAVDTDPPPPLLRKALSAWKGERGGQLWIVDKNNGSTRAEYHLESPPVHDGMATSHERLFISTMDGTVLCFGAAG